MLALSPRLERRILELAATDRIVAAPVDDAPQFETDTPVDVLRAMVHVRTDGALVVPVWSGASDQTIWSCADVNRVFRAVHDSHHLATGLGFDAVSEHALAHHICRLVDKRDRAILWAEVHGQVEYFTTWGRFPVAQREFVRAYVSDSARTIEQGRF